MMRALVIGGGGYIGSRLSSRLARENWDVTAVMLPSLHGTRDATERGVRVVHGDRRGPEFFRRALRSDTDAVFDLISYHPADTEAVVKDGAGRLGRLIHLSTVSVYGQYPKRGRAAAVDLVCLNGDMTGYG